jgi:intracellular septation protein
MLKVLQFLPVILWFITYKMTSNLILSTAVIVVACVISTAVEYAMTKQLSRMQIFLVAAVLLFGLPTVLLNDPSIIKWKVTVVNFLFAATIFVFQFILKKNPFAFLFEKELPLPQEAYNTLSVWWMVFFVAAGLLNIVIAFYLPALIGVTEVEAEEIWVDYKTFGNAILNGIFALICGFVLLKKYPDIIKNIEK